MLIFIKNMVCHRCVLVIKQQLQAINLSYKDVRMGELELFEPPSAEQLEQLNLQQKQFRIIF